MSTTTEPIWAADADGTWWRFFWWARPEWNQAVCDWLTAEGMNPKAVKAVEVYLLDTLHARITEHVYDDSGQVMLDPSQPSQIPLERTYTRLVSSYPPQWPQERPEEEAR